VTPYPFGSDGNPVDPNSDFCRGGLAGEQYGPAWNGEFASSGGANRGNPPCYLQATSFAFRAWNRGLAATGQPANNNDPSGSVAFGVWLYNGSNWFPDPTFPGSAACPGSTVLWAGKLDYWLIGSSPQPPNSTVTLGTGPQRTLCRFDGTNLVWEPLPLPAATVARLPIDLVTGTPVGGITSGACFAWNNCWFFGTDGIEVHWDGERLADASIGLSTSPWLQDDFSAAAAGIDPSGRTFGLAAAKSGVTVGLGPSGVVQGTAAPDGSPPAQLFGSQGGPFAPLTYSAPATAPFTADLTAASVDSQGHAWVAANTVTWGQNGPTVPPSAQPAPLDRRSENGAQAPCPGYGATTFTVGPSINGYRWTALAAANDGSAFASVLYENTSQKFQAGPPSASNPPVANPEPALVHAVCGQPPTVTEFRRPDPFSADQADAPLVPADFVGAATAVAAPATNDAWAATTDGNWKSADVNNPIGGSLRPHVYLWTDGQPPDAPAGDDSEQRPSLFTLDAPVYQVAPPAVVVTPVVVTTTETKKNTTTIRLKPAIYAIHSRLVPSAGGTFTLYLTFKVRRPVTIGLQGLRRGRVVASTGLKHFRGHSGQLALTLDRNHWPTRLRLETPKTGKKVVDAPIGAPTRVDPVKAVRRG
jgi:hypothetical protein